MNRKRQRYNGEDLWDAADEHDLATGGADIIDADDLYQLEPTRAAIPARPLCAGSGLVRRVHRVGHPLDRYAVQSDNRRWLFCGDACMTAWVAEVAGAVS